MAKDKKKKKGNIITVDFTGVESGGGSGKAPDEGRYEVEVAEVTQEDGSEYPYLAFVYSITGPGKAKGKLYDNCSLSPAALWRLRGVLEALGVEVPDEETDIDLEDLIGRTMGVEVTHEEYNKKQQARITDVFDVEEIDAEEEPVKGKKKKSKDEDEEEEDDTPKSKKGKKSKDEDEEEDDEPKKKKGKKKKTSLTSDDVLEMDDEGLQEVIDEHSLDVDLEEFNTTRRKRAAVIEALTEAGVIEEE